MKPELKQLYEMVEEIEVAMMTTRRPDGHLESRPMATQKRASGADLWFVAAEGSGKTRDIAADPHVNLAYYKDRTREWVSVSGTTAAARSLPPISSTRAPATSAAGTRSKRVRMTPPRNAGSTATTASVSSIGITK